MQTTAHIGKSIHIKGTITAEEQLTIAGHVEGSIAITGHALTVAPDGRIDAETVADTIVIDGTAKGRLNAMTRIVVRATASISGDVSAPAISLAEGATVHGRIDTGVRKTVSSQMAADLPVPGKSAA